MSIPGNGRQDSNLGTSENNIASYQKTICSPLRVSREILLRGVPQSFYNISHEVGEPKNDLESMELAIGFEPTTG